MNHLVTDLARQCGLKKHPSEDREFIGDFDWRVFAELIIRECIVQIGDAIPDTNCSAADAYKTAKLAATSRVKKHFGVIE